jgi:glycosyltransferase involved in cell wall biosynthesis
MTSASTGAPQVSVVIPSYNGAPFICQAVESALRQTVAAIEVLVIDDGSTDDTPLRLRSFRDPRLRVIQRSHQGAPAALNCGVSQACGEYIGFLDHDDLWLPSKLERHLECFAAYPALAATFSWYGLIDEVGQRINLTPSRWRGPIDFSQLLADFVIGSTSSLLIRRSVILDAGCFDARFPRAHDQDLVLRISLAHPGGIRAVPEELTLYRRHSGQMSRDWRAMYREWNALLEKLRALAPEQTAAVEALARSNMIRYYACLAYEEARFSEASSLIRDSLRAHPRAFLRDWRNWRVSAACASALLLPPALHRNLERLALGIKVQR